jgi:non-ribosomal peptide synthetase-like protein
VSTAVAEAPTAGPEPGPPARGTEQVLAELLAGVLCVERVSLDSDFFDHLGADSLLLASFCARARKRPDLPPISVEDVYKHPTIRSLAASLTDRSAASAEAPVPPPVEPTGAAMASVGRPQYFLTVAIQLLALLAAMSAVALVGAAGAAWISAASGWSDAYLRAVGFGAATFLVVCMLPILAKWTLVGRWKREEIPIWSLLYVRFWVVATLIRLNPMVLLAGSPLYVMYLRALGAKIGRGAVIFSRHAPVCTDLLRIGGGAVVRKDSFFTGYRAEAGVIRTGSVTIGKHAVVGEITVLDIDTAIGDAAQLGHSSSLQAGHTIPGGERRYGSAAEKRAEVDLQAVEPASCSGFRRAVYAGLELAGLLAVVVPLAVGGVAMLAAALPQLAALFSVAPAELASWAFIRDALVVSLVLFFVPLLATLLFVCTVPRVLNLAITPNRTYRLYGFHYAVHRAIARLTNVRFLNHLFGDSSYVVHYLRGLGYDLSRIEQTGSNFGLEMKHETPFLASVGTGTMVADGLSIINADFSSTSFRVSHATIGPRNFLGNYVAYPSQSRAGDNCLLATKVMVPVDGEARDDTGLLGSPSFEIPRSVERDRAFGHLERGAERRRRLAAKNRHNAGTIGLFLLARWIYVLAITVLAASAVALHDAAGAAAAAAAFSLALPFTAGYFALVERAAAGFRALRPRFCSIYQPYFWWHERYWKLGVQPPRVLDGTPFKSLVWRAQGVRVGKRVFDDGARMIEKSLVRIGDGCALNRGSIVQAHSQEDGSFKSDRITIGAGCTIGVGALVHYGVTMGEGATLAPDSFLMKGTEVPPNTRWGMNPARELREPIAVRTGAGGPGPDRDLRRGVPAAEGSSPVPRWTREPVEGAAEHVAAVPGDVAGALRRLADELEVPLSTIMLAAHARVLSSLTGEGEVTIGYVAAVGGPPLPCRVDTEVDSWRALLREARRVESKRLSHRGLAVGGVARESGLPEASFETVLDPTGGDEPSGDALLRVGVSERGAQLSLRVACRTEALDADYAARIVGYHVTALGLIAADPEARPARQSLLSPAEVRRQLDGFAGPRRELPDRRFHELFEERAAAHPSLVAAVLGDRQLTYGELNARANRLARALLARGLRREGVVAVVTERNLDWMTAVLAIFKAGGAYLPIQPDFPADRIAATLSRAACELVLTEPDSTAALDRTLESLPGVERLFIEDAVAESHDDADLGIEVAPDQLAYIYFTSGSTGRPKGAMCEHAGMLNHLQAKIDDLELGEGHVVAQIAPQSFDISLWQLVSPLLVGGRTLIVEQDSILDVEQFLERIVGGRANVLQVVPSYLEALVSHLEQYPRGLPDLRYVSVTGEALTGELAGRWFALAPEIKLVNAYGLTETSDDTNHEIMVRAPDSDRVPLGRPVNNVDVYVVDEHMQHVPLGAPGEIVFSGVCVGRGYVNDGERTRVAFAEDPYREGQRLYRSGDYGRWRPDGKLEFLGRRDAQVKIRGFRIEIGEIEGALSRIPGVRAAAAVVVERAGGRKQLVAFHSGRPLDADALRAALGESLPSYMVPRAFHRRQSLPLTANGKVDRRSLAAVAEALDTGGVGR